MSMGLSDDMILFKLSAIARPPTSAQARKSKQCNHLLFDHTIYLFFIVFVLVFHTVSPFLSGREVETTKRQLD